MFHAVKLILSGLLLFTFVACSTSSRVSLPIQHQGDEPNQGVASCASMVLRYYSEQISADSIRKLVRQREDFAGMYYVDLVAGLEKIGFYWQPMGFDLDHLGFQAGIKAIKEHLDDDRPVLISTSSPPIGYTLIVVGYDEDKQSVELRDPGVPGSWVISNDELEKIWFDDFQKNDRWILATYPHGRHPKR